MSVFINYDTSVTNRMKQALRGLVNWGFRYGPLCSDADIKSFCVKYIPTKLHTSVNNHRLHLEAYIFKKIKGFWITRRNSQRKKIKSWVEKNLIELKELEEKLKQDVTQTEKDNCQNLFKSMVEKAAEHAIKTLKQNQSSIEWAIEPHCTSAEIQWYTWVINSEVHGKELSGPGPTSNPEWNSVLVPDFAKIDNHPDYLILMLSNHIHENQSLTSIVESRSTPSEPQNVIYENSLFNITSILKDLAQDLISFKIEFQQHLVEVKELKNDLTEIKLLLTSKKRKRNELNIFDRAIELPDSADDFQVEKPHKKSPKTSQTSSPSSSTTTTSTTASYNDLDFNEDLLVDDNYDILVMKDSYYSTTSSTNSAATAPLGFSLNTANNTVISTISCSPATVDTSVVSVTAASSSLSATAEISDLPSTVADTSADPTSSNSTQTLLVKYGFVRDEWLKKTSSELRELGKKHGALVKGLRNVGNLVTIIEKHLQSKK